MVVTAAPKLATAGARRAAEAIPLLDVRGLSVGFRNGNGTTPVVRDVSFSIAPGETLAIVGESGSGKSVTSLAIMGLLPVPAARLGGGTILWRGADGRTVDLARAPAATVRKLRGRQLAMIFQEPMTSLNPVYSVGAQIVEMVRLHTSLGQRAALERAADMLALVGIPEPRKRLASLPHELSGGMRQRVMIAMALSCDPRLLIADEPTTALDVTIQAQILELIGRLQAELGMAVLFITHDLGVVAEIADRVAVMYGGRIVETGAVAAILARPAHPYTRGLLASLPRLVRKAQRAARLTVLPGNVPDPTSLPSGCAFRTRCRHARPGLCDSAEPVLEPTDEDGLVRCLRWREAVAELP